MRAILSATRAWIGFRLRTHCEYCSDLLGLVFACMTAALRRYGHGPGDIGVQLCISAALVRASHNAWTQATSASGGLCTEADVPHLAATCLGAVELLIMCADGAAKLLATAEERQRQHGNGDSNLFDVDKVVFEAFVATAASRAQRIAWAARVCAPVLVQVETDASTPPEVAAMVRRIAHADDDPGHAVLFPSGSDFGDCGAGDEGPTDAAAW